MAGFVDMSTRTIAALVGFGLLAAPLAALEPVGPGVVFESEIKDVRRNTTQAMTASIEGNLIKVDVPGEAGQAKNAMVFRGDRQELVAIDHGRRTYMVIDQATVKQLASQVGAAMSQMQAMMQNLPPEQRAAMEQAMRGRGMGAAMGPPPAPAELKRTTERAEHAGYDTVKYEVLRGDRKVREMWVTDWANLPGANEVRGAFESMGTFAKELFSNLAQVAGQMDLDIYEQMQQANGYPVLTIEFNEAGEPTTETRLVSAAERTVDPSTFEPPADYRRETMGGRNR